ncbi:glycoside hydrolase family 15 protein [Halomarina pelagica]|uniref:glycoside hydrolase family 15 protein n=1 Tax=Halomarina pelagica TaxID=2961599 RepID=UPI0020C3D550|nr:glycoside hydrolase family 15 protein [Halomarina sp. BND7]
MHLRDALNDYNQHRGDRTRVPGERRTTTGRFSGDGGRLVHVETDGSIRDFSYPLVGLAGIARSRFGVRPADGADADVTWFDAGATQRWCDGTALVVTDHETAYGRVVQYDLTLDDVHVTHFDASAAGRSLEVVACVGFAPDGRDTRVGQLHHGDAVEVYHAEETDYLASATGFEAVRGVAFGGFDELLDRTPAEYPRGGSATPDAHPLSGDVVCVVPTDAGAATLATLLTTRADRPREAALDAVRAAARDRDRASLERVADRRGPPTVDPDLPHADALAADLRVLSSLSGRTGLRVAGPDFDPYYAHSGGYGYSWFRDDSEISRFLLEADRHFDLGLDDWHARSAAVYRETQLDDGTWPHRVWPFDATLAPGWANARLEAGDGVDYQADQTGSVAAFLAAADGDGRETLERALDGLDDGLAADGRPVTCQNAWEDTTGRFAHTAATFLEAYSALAATGMDGVADRAAARAERVYDALDDLWVDDRGVYALREYGGDHERAGDLDGRCDSATLALASAHRAYARVGDLDDRRLDRLVSHVETVVAELTRDTAAVAGLVRYEGDEWRRREQEREKIWTVSTAWGAHAAATLAAIFADRGDGRADRLAATARDLLALVLPGGPLCLDSGYLPEQVFDDGTPDSATPLGWPHALRLATVALMDEYGLLER